MPRKMDLILSPETRKQKKSSQVARKPREITERKQTLEALRASEDKFKYMFEHSAVGRSITLPSGEINVNQALCEMLGYTRDEIKKYKWQEITHPDDVELTQNEIDALISGKKESARFIKRYIHKDGPVIWADVGSVLRRDKDGKPLYFISTIMDITERKLAEEALRISEEKWRSLVNALPDYIALHDPDGRYLFLNHYAKGFTDKDVLGTSLYQYLLPESVELFRSKMEKALQTWIVQHFEMAALGDDGSFRTYDEYLVPLHGKGAEIYTLAVARDITEPKQAETALCLSEQRLREVLENLLDASYKRDLRTNGYEYFSPAIARLSGYSPEEMKSLNLETVLELIHPDDSPEVNYRINEALSGIPGAVWQVEYRFKHKQGQYRWFQDRFTIMRDPRGQPVALIGSVSDITARKQVEEALRQKMEELERFQRLTVGRELRMIEMKKEINALLVQSGQPEKYPLPLESHSERSQ